MKVKIVILAFFLIFTGQQAKAKGALDAMTEFCTVSLPAVQGIANLTIPHLYPTIQATPIGPMPGLMLGLAQQSSVMVELCDIAMNLSELEGFDALFYSGQVLNKMTDNQWTHHLDQADATWNLANTIYDFEAGQTRKAAFESASTYQEINDFMGTSYSWYHKSFNGQDAKLKNRYEREQDMAELARVAQRRAVLQEAMNCPSGEPDNQDYGKIYKKEVEPWVMKREEAREDYEFYKGQMLQMGPRFMNNQREMQEYIRDIENLETAGVSYQVTTKKKNEQTKKPSGRLDRKTGKPRWTTKTITRETQVFKPRLYTDLFQKFRDRWGDQWYSWVTAQYLSRGTEGILNDPRGKVESEFVDLSYECNMAKLMKGVDPDRPDYFREQDRRREECQKRIRTNQSKSEGLLNYYVNALQNSLYKMKQANAYIWTAESWHIGKNRNISNDNPTGFQQENVTCEDSKNFSPAEMNYLKLKQQENLNEYKNIISKNQMKKTNMIEQEAKGEAETLEEIRRRRAFAERQNKEAAKDQSDAIAPVSVKGGM